MIQNAPLVFVPGLGCDGDMYAQQIRDLSDRYPCWCAPLPPHTDLAVLAQEILHRCPFERFVLLGASMGGYLCFEIYRLAPQRVLGLVPVVTMAEPDDQELSERRKTLNEMVDNGRWHSMWRISVRRCLAPANRGNRGLADAVFRHVIRTAPEAFKAHQVALSKRTGYVDMLSTIKCPTLVLAGSDDQVIPVDRQRALATGIPASQFVSLGRCGHLPTFEAPTAVSRTLLEWLESQIALAA